MDKYNLKDDVKVYCTAAKSFPQGIQEAFITLEKMLSKEGRTFYGISYKSRDDNIIYKRQFQKALKAKQKNMALKPS